MKLIIKVSSFITIIGVFALFPYFFGYSSLIQSTTINNITVLTIDLNKYCINISNYLENFKNNIKSIYQIPLGWDTVINSIKSICNILISVLNTLILPFSLVIQIMPLIFGLLGWSIERDNFFVQVFSGLNGLQIPYLNIS